MGRIGGGLESLSELKATFDQQAGIAEELRRTLSTRLAQVDWEGPAAARFQNAWASDFEPNLRRLRSALEECATEVERRKQALMDAGG